MPGLKSAVRRRRITAVTVKLAVLGVLVLVLGFAGFVWLLPSQEVALDRNADGIVVLTGGTSRVTDALELLAAGRGKRLLITGVNPGTTTGDIARQTVDYGRLLNCCVDLDYSALNTLGNAVQARRWAIEHGFQVAHRRDLGVPHAARAGRARPSASRRRPHPVPGGVRPPAHRAVVVERRNDEAGAVGISQIPFRQGAHAVRHRG